MHLLVNLAVIAAGGAIGCISRYGVEHLGIFEDDKYYYTVGINVSGCIFIGVLWALLRHWNADQMWHLFVVSGILGGYTTYSAFILDALQLVQQGRIWQALFYVGITFIGGFAGCAMGLYTTERLLR